jgi:hypothetical protein
VPPSHQGAFDAGLPDSLPLIFVIADDRLIATTHGKAVTAENPNLLP